MLHWVASFRFLDIHVWAKDVAFYENFARVINWCFNASVGVHRFSGLRFRHLSSRSTNWLNSFISPSSMPFTFAINRVLRSRVGFVKFKTRTTSWREPHVSFSNQTLGKGGWYKRNKIPCRKADPSQHCESSVSHQNANQQTGLFEVSYGWIFLCTP